MKRNHARLNQTSVAMLQGWRANCDVQLLVYRCNPKNPDPSEIAKVTDYVAAYSCKGNYSLKEERQHTQDLIMQAEELTGDKRDVVRVCKHIMNKCASKRLISKQEAMVLLADLPLTSCSEGFETVSLTNSKRLSLHNDKSNKQKEDKKFVTMYANRANRFQSLSLHEYFHLVKNTGHKDKRIGAKILIPSFVGVNGRPCYPVTEEYARHTIIVYKPWREFPKNLKWISEFNNFINSQSCPISARLPYEREMHRNFDNMAHYEATASKADHSNNELSDEDRELLELLGLRDQEYVERDEAVLKSMDYGKNHDWGSPPKVSALPWKISWQLYVLPRKNTCIKWL